MRIILEKPISLSFVKKHFGKSCTLTDESIIINAVTTDSRLAERNDLFFAINGDKLSGEEFAPDAKSNGAFTVCKYYADADITVSDTRRALLSLAGAYKSLFLIKTTVAITGSVGKTTTKNLTAKLLSSKYNVHATSGNFNNELGVSYTLFSLRANTEILIAEAGMNHKGELALIESALRPDISVITNIGTAHIGNLGSREAIAAAKSEILGQAKECFALIPHGEPLLSGLPSCALVSTSNPGADFYLEVKKEGSRKIEFDYHCPNFSVTDLKMSTAGLHFKECLAFAIAAAITVGMSRSELLAALAKQELFSGTNREKIGSITVIDDSYNASFESVSIALRGLAEEADGEYSALLGDMLELGDYSEQLHFGIGRIAAECGVKRLYTFGNYSDYIRRGAMSAGMDSSNIFINNDIGDPEKTAIEIKNNSKDETLLLKASHAIGLVRIKDILKKLYH